MNGDRVTVVRAAHRRAHAAFLAHFRACGACVNGVFCDAGRRLDEDADVLGRQLDAAVEAARFLRFKRPIAA